MKAAPNNLIVTLADKNFINKAKQLFSSIYHNSGWLGDYLLLAYEIPDEDLAWFKSKGILIYKCQPLTTGKIGLHAHPAVVLAKFYLLKDYFRQWEKVIFLDADIIVKTSLDYLTQFEEFSAPNATSLNLKKEFINDGHLFPLLKKRFPLKGRAFNSGVMVFNYKNIAPGAFDKIISLYQEFGAINAYGEEATFNLFFYKNWRLLPIVFNAYPPYFKHLLGLDTNKFKASIIHFVSPVKPWNPISPYFCEWQENLKKADLIDLTKRPTAKETWTDRELSRYLKYILFKKTIRAIPMAINHQIGRLGLLIKRFSPRLYEKIKIKKNTTI